MNDPDDHDPMDDLLPGFQRDTPFGRALEHFLDQTGGPVPVDDDAVRRAASSLAARVGGAPPRPRWAWGAGVIALAAAALVALSVMPERVAVEPTAGTVDLAGAVVAPDTEVVALDAELRLDRGALRLERDVPVQAGAIHLVPSDAAWVVGRRDDLVGVGVITGSVTIETPTTRTTVGPGGWASTRGGPVRRLEPTSRPTETEAADLLSTLRWLALPEETRAAIGGAP